MKYLIAFYRKMHSSDALTWIAHAVQAFLIVALTYGFMSIMPGEFGHELKMGVGTYGALMVFGHREISDIIPAWVAVREADERNRAERQNHFTAKLKDGFGDLFSVPVGVALFALLSSLLGA